MSCRAGLLLLVLVGLTAVPACGDVYGDSVDWTAQGRALGTNLRDLGIGRTEDLCRREAAALASELGASRERVDEMTAACVRT